MANLKDLVENEHVAALIQQVTSQTLAAQQGYIESKQIPVIGGDVLQGVWNRSRFFFPQQASSTEQLLGIYKSGQRYPNGNKVAFV